MNRIISCVRHRDPPLRRAGGRQGRQHAIPHISYVRLQCPVTHFADVAKTEIKQSRSDNTYQNSRPYFCPTTFDSIFEHLAQYVEAGGAYNRRSRCRHLVSSGDRRSIDIGATRQFITTWHLPLWIVSSADTQWSIGFENREGGQKLILYQLYSKTTVFSSR